MNNTTTRIGLSAIAAFYLVIGGLWAIDYFPLQKLYAQAEIQNTVAERVGYQAAYETQEYKKATAYQERYALSHSDIYGTEAKLAFYQSLLLWGTVAIGVGGGVLFLTRGRGAQPAKGDAQ